MPFSKSLFKVIFLCFFTGLISCKKEPIYQGRFENDGDSPPSSSAEKAVEILSVEIFSFEGFEDYSLHDGFSGPDICFRNPSEYISIFDNWYPNPVNNVLPSSLPRKFTSHLPEYPDFDDFSNFRLEIGDADPGQGFGGQNLLVIHFDYFTTKLGIHRVKAMQGDVIIEYRIFER
jgi:hypothetical protein